MTVYYFYLFIILFITNVNEKTMQIVFSIGEIINKWTAKQQLKNKIHFTIIRINANFDNTY